MKSCLSTPEHQQLQLFLLGIHHVISTHTSPFPLSWHKIQKRMEATCFTLK